VDRCGFFGVRLLLGTIVKSKCKNQKSKLQFKIIKLKSSSAFPDIEKSRAMLEALDSINDEYGANTAYYASSYYGHEAAPDRIPFGMPRYEIRH